MNQLEQKLTSLEVAEMVEKDHKELLRDIRRYSEQLGESNIAQSDFFTENTYQNSQNKTQPCYLVTKKGCELIANKLTGTKGTIFTAKYVNKFHDMEDALQLPTTYKEALQQLLSQVEENEKLIEQKSELEESVKKMDKVICDMTPKADYVDRILSSTDCMTVTQIAQDYGMSAVKFNKVLANACIQRHVGGQWILYSDHQGKGYVRNKTCEYQKTNGTGTNLLTVWTQKGRMFLYDRLKTIGIEPVVV